MAGRENFDFRLRNPGLVENSSNAEHCVHACFQMIFRTRSGAEVPSFDTLDRAMNKEPGKYTWEHGLLAEMPKHGFEVKIIWSFDLNRLSSETEKYLIELYGKEVGEETIRNSNIKLVSAGASKLLNSDVAIEKRVPESRDVIEAVRGGYYILATINQRVLQSDPGYVAHNVLIFGASNRGVRIHNPGPPSTESSEITWEMFDKAWSFPNESARNLMLFRPQ